MNPSCLPISPHWHEWLACLLWVRIIAYFKISSRSFYKNFKNILKTELFTAQSYRACLPFVFAMKNEKNRTFFKEKT
ncbi:hypothetical protein [Moraxella lacunata]|uniref:hypothetical protein n=1 Tax=Moraxella lacunata TaxID=477 RepID=UPI003EE1C4F6